MIQHSDIEYRECSFCKKFTAHYEGKCFEHDLIEPSIKERNINDY